MISADVSRASAPKSGRSCCRAYPSGSDRRASQSSGPAISRLLVDLLSINSLSEAQIGTDPRPGRPFFHDDPRRALDEPLKGRIVFNLFYENSTRTAMSFATAAHRLGASAISLSVEHSSVKKGETLEDTARTLNAMRPDAVVIRHRDNGAPADRCRDHGDACHQRRRRNQRASHAGASGCCNDSKALRPNRRT